MNVAAWLHELGLAQYVQTFADNDVDAQTLRLLTEADLAAIGVNSVGHRRRLAAAIANLCDVPAAQAVSERARAVGPAERRQLSILYCDMVGSTALSQRLELEAYRELIRSFHDRCVCTVAQYDGWVANFIGDCVLAYFGWPRAHEDDPERAVRTGLALVDAAAANGVQVRVGIATGPVVVGDLTRAGPAREQSAVGMTPDLAARLQALAEPGQVVIDALTHRLAPIFAARTLPVELLDGRPLRAYAVTGERHTDSRFDARKGHELASMVGRDRELSILTERWHQAQNHDGQAVLLVGEAGIGKSRLTRAMLDGCAPNVQRVRWQCSPYHTGSALWPVIQQLSRAAGLQVEDSTEAALDKLEATVGKDDTSAMFATLLGLNGAQRYGPVQMTPQMLRERTLEVLVEQLFETAERQPLLLVVEDAHWIDPTTLELIERCLDRIDRSRMLVLLTSRPDNQPRFAAHPCVMRLSLNRLNRSSVQEMVTHLAGDRLKPHTMAMIAAQADGVPLFVEELTKAVLETGETEIPASLHGSLMARLDRLPDVKEVVHFAACMGRDFDAALLKAVVQKPEAVDDALRRLVEAELIFRRSGHVAEGYSFKHALLHAVAYDSMLRTKRKAAHAQLLRLLEATRPDTLPEILAYHAQGADLPDQAIGHWSDAGDAALDKSAYREATTCYLHAIELLMQLPESTERDNRELQLQLRLGSASVAMQVAADVPKRAYERVCQLLESGQHDPEARHTAQFGLWAGQLNRGEILNSLHLAAKALEAEQADGTPDTLLQAHRLYATSNHFLGNFTVARQHFELAIGLIHSPQRAQMTSQCGLDPAVTSLCDLGIAKSIQGDIAMGRHHQQEALDLGADTPHVHAKACMYFLRAVHAACVRDTAAAAADADALENLIFRSELELFPARVLWLRVWLLIANGAPALEAARRCEKAVADLVAKGARMFVPFYRGSLALALAGEGHNSDSSAMIDAALQECRASAQGWYEAELLRIRAELLWRGGPRHAEEAERFYRQAIVTARRQGARLWELRAVAGLARLWAEQGRRTEGLQMVSSVAGQFDGSADAVDLVDARRLLAELA